MESNDEVSSICETVNYTGNVWQTQCKLMSSWERILHWRLSSRAELLDADVIRLSGRCFADCRCPAVSLGLGQLYN